MSTNEHDVDEELVKNTEDASMNAANSIEAHYEDLDATGKLDLSDSEPVISTDADAAPATEVIDPQVDMAAATQYDEEAVSLVADDAVAVAAADVSAPEANVYAQPPVPETQIPIADTNEFATTPMPASAFTQPNQTPSQRSALLSIPSLDEDSTTTQEEPAAESYVEPEAFDSEPVVQGVEAPVNKVSPFAEGGSGRRALIIVGIVAAALLIIYVIGGLFFSSHFMPNTRVNGEEVSGMSVDDLAAHVTDLGATYQTHVTGDGLDFTINAADIDLSYDGVAYSKEAQDQIGPWKWPVRIFKSHDFRASTGIAFDTAKVDAIVGSAVDKLNENVQPPTNAAFTYSEEEQKFVSTPDSLGTMVDRNTTIATVSDGISTLQTNIELGDKDLTQPVVREDDERLTAVIDRANNLATATIPLRIAARDAGAVDGNLLKGWLGTNENCELVINRDAVLEWAQGDLSNRFDSVGTTRRYTRPDGKDVEVSGGEYGWNLDSDALANIIVSNLSVDKVDPIDVPMKSVAAEWNPGGADWGKRYIDVDMSEQTVRVYDENSELVLESPCVTGVPYHATDEGVYTIFEHTANMVLVGLDYNGDGAPDYETPVSYWMPFNGGQGLHDAYWRGAFGGDIYLYDGSHGCVNLPSDVAAQLFDWSHVDDVVVVHW